MLRLLNEMIKKKFPVLVASLLIFNFNFFVFADYNTSDMNIVNDPVLQSRNKYSSYILNYQNALRAKNDIGVDITSFQSKTSPIIVKDFEGRTGYAVKTSDFDEIEWSINVEEEGLYNISVDYFPLIGSGGVITRELKIDGVTPFFEASNLEFSRAFSNQGDFVTDTSGNEMLPVQIEKQTWLNTVLKDSSGYNSEPFSFFLSKGAHKISFSSVSEPMAIGKIVVGNAYTPSYEELKKVYADNGFKETENIISKIQGENASLKSDSMLYPIFDRSSPATEPFHISKIRLNTIGGDKWKTNGQWLEWEYNAPQSGLYNIAIKARQNLINGSVSTRKLFIDGKIPFAKAKNLVFSYDTDWKMFELKDGEKPYLFYFEKGIHKIKLEVSLGEMSKTIQNVNDCLVNLSRIFRNILILTGPTPDIYRDYEFETQIPDTLKEMENESKKLKEIYFDLLKATGQNGQNIQIIKKIYLQTEEMAKKPKNIPARFDAFKSNIGALGTWIITTKQQPLEIDYIVIKSPNVSYPVVSKGLIDNILYSVNSFFVSFFENYNTFGEDAKNSVKVWIGNGATGGRDQAQVLKQLINNYFTQKNGIKVNLELVPMGSLLSATLAGKGPDIALTVGSGDPVNYALRNAVVNLKEFKDYSSVEKSFKASAIEPLSFNGAVYGLPETQSFPMLFYRKDILKDLNLTVPKTWEDVLKILPALQKKQMNFALPSPVGEGVGVGLTTYAMFLYQNGGKFYNESYSKAVLSEKVAIDSFYKWTYFYSNYKIPLSYDFLNRFRLGEIPLGIADYSTFNSLSVFAPEIFDLWGFEAVPGTLKKDGTIDRSVASNISACIIMKNAKDKDKSWEFIKWWTSADTQTRFGQELESILGTAARYPTANVEALKKIPWSKENFEKLMTQWEWVKAIPEVPGGYYTGRNIDFAFRSVVNESEDPGEQLEDATKVINDEIKIKREEFGLEN